jgi:hypothetical protein
MKQTMQPMPKWTGAAMALTTLILTGLMACGGGSSTPPPQPNPTPTTATSLVYTDPSSGTYKLVKNTASTATHLVLDLVGPADTGSGVSVAFSADATKATWVDVPPGGTTALLVANGTQFDLGTGTAILKAKANGGALQAVVAQKGITNPASLNGPLLRVALDLKTGQAPDTVAFTADSAKCQVIDSTGAIAPITVSLGTLAAQ